MLNDFFYYLSNRRYKENDLSDITWTMCNACDRFKRFFLTYFFPDLDPDDVTDIVREKADETDGDSRVDFYIETQHRGRYLIEVKIGDRQHHFEQYDRAYRISPDRFGYITNYPLHAEGYETRQWEDFYRRLKDESSRIEDKEGKALIDGYLTYVKQVCGIIELKTDMRLKGLYSLYELMQILTGSVNRANEDFTLGLYNDKKGNRNGVQGIYFKIEYANGRIDDTWAWVGIYYERENPLICLGFSSESGWGKPVYDLLQTSDRHREGSFATAPYPENGWYYFELSEAKHEAFENMTLEAQKKLLEDFIDEVVRYPLHLQNGL